MPTKQRILTGLDPGPVDVVWTCDDGLRTLLWIMWVVSVGVATKFFFHPAPNESAAWRIGEVVVAFVVVPLFVWAVGYRPRIAIIGDQLFVVNLPRTYVIPLRQIRSATPYSFSLTITWWDGRAMDEVTAWAVQKPRAADLFNVESRADQVASAIKSRVPAF